MAANILQLMAGAAIQDGTSIDNQGLKFPDDGVNNTGGWILYLPTSIKELTNVPLRFIFLSGGGSGNKARFTVEYKVYNETTALISSGFTAFLITDTAATFVYNDIEISSWLPANATHIELTLGRDSSDPADTLAADVFFFNGHTLEV
jgi:hypothetical protein